MGDELRSRGALAACVCTSVAHRERASSSSSSSAPLRDPVVAPLALLTSTFTGACASLSPFTRVPLEISMVLDKAMREELPAPSPSAAANHAPMRGDSKTSRPPPEGKQLERRGLLGTKTREMFVLTCRRRSVWRGPGLRPHRRLPRPNRHLDLAASPSPAVYPFALRNCLDALLADPRTRKYTSHIAPPHPCRPYPPSPCSNCPVLLARTGSSRSSTRWMLSSVMKLFSPGHARAQHRGLSGSPSTSRCLRTPLSFVCCLPSRWRVVAKTATRSTFSLKPRSPRLRRRLSMRSPSRSSPSVQSKELDVDC